jgi:hypothetical protein
MERPIWPNETADIASNKTENNTERITNILRIVLLSARSVFCSPIVYEARGYSDGEGDFLTELSSEGPVE